MKGVRETLVVEIDAKATALVRRHINGQSFAERHGDDPRAVVSAAVCFLFTEDADGHEELTEATARLERRVGRVVVQQHPPVPVPIDVEAAELLARYCLQSGQDARDVASGAVYCLLAAKLGLGTFSDAECTASAQSRRLTRAKRVKQKAWQSRRQQKRGGAE